MTKPNKQIKRQLLNILFLVILVGITVVVLVLSNRELNFETVLGFLRKCDPWWMAAAFLAMIGFVTFEGMSLHFILHGLGEKPKLRSSIVFSTADIYYSAITPSASGGQPASAYYMVKDGIAAGKASFALVFNLIAYTTAIIVIGIVAFCVRPTFFGALDSWFAQLLIVLGFVVQSLLLSFFVACMFCGRAVLKLGNGIISLLNKMKIVKKPEKWRNRLAEEVAKFKDCRSAIREKPLMSLANFSFNLLQRVCHVLISCFVCLAAAPSANFWDLFVLQAFVLVGYNSIPLPGGVGAFEFLYLHIYGIAFGDAFILAAMMITRVISYYLCMILSGVYTLVYHAHLVKKMGKKIAEEGKEGENTNEIGESTDEKGAGEQE